MDMQSTTAWLNALVGRIDPLVATGTALLLCLLVLAVLLTHLRALRQQLAHQLGEAERTSALLQAEVARTQQALHEGQARIEEGIFARSVAETRLSETEERLATAVAERDHAMVQRETALAACAEAERDAALRGQQLLDMEQRINDWERTKAESVQAARAAVLSTANEVSSKLLEDHKREAAEARKDAEERVRKTTEDLLQKLQDVTRSVAALDKQVDATQERMETVWKALSSPGGAGQFAEIGLENTLKQFGLEKGRDFLVQSALEGSRLRPDALVFLPNATVLVIDSKASKFLLDVAAAEGTPQEPEAYQSLARTMNLHLKALADRNYRSEIADAWRRVGRSGEIERCVIAMYLPNEGALEKLNRADPEFRHKARRAEISVAGPEALACLIAFTAIQIDFVRRIDNQERIVEATQGLIDGIGVVLEHAEKVGRGIKTAADSYVQMTGSVNGRLLPRVKGIMALGVRPTRAKPVRDRLPSYQVVALETGETIEGEVDTPTPLPAPRGIN